MAILQQERHAEPYAPSAQAFIITNRMVSYDTGELPHVNVFVMTVKERSDPKSDTLARVAQVADLLSLVIGRNAILATTTNAGGLYLSSTCQLIYYSLEEALAAATAIKDRVNVLILSWQNYNTLFSAPDPTPENIHLPTSDLSQLCTLIEAYKVAKQDRYQKERTKDAADTTKNTAELDLTYKQGLLNLSEADCALRSTLTANVSAASTALTVAQTNQVAATQALTLAQSLETSTLNAVLALDPDFDKYTIPLVDDVPPGP